MPKIKNYERRTKASMPPKTSGPRPAYREVLTPRIGHQAPPSPAASVPTSRQIDLQTKKAAGASKLTKGKAKTTKATSKKSSTSSKASTPTSNESLKRKRDAPAASPTAEELKEAPTYLDSILAVYRDILHNGNTSGAFNGALAALRKAADEVEALVDLSDEMPTQPTKKIKPSLVSIDSEDEILDGSEDDESGE